MDNNDHQLPKNMLEMVPVKTCRWYISHSTGRHVIRKKRFIRKPSVYQRLFMRLLKRDKFIKIYLDDYGSYVFQSIDGKRNVRKIGEFVRKRYGGNVRALYPRVSSFLTNMASNGIIRFE